MRKRIAAAGKLLTTFACVHLLLSCTAAGQAQPHADLWPRLQAGGYVVLMEHASAVHPLQQSLSLPQADCTAHETLSSQGRLQAARLRDDFQRQNVPIGRVLTSHDCRCIQTAGIIFGRAEPWSIIDDALHDDESDRAEKRLALREAIRHWSSAANLVLISHPENFRQAFGVSPGAAQMLVIEPLGDDGLRLLGRVPAE